MIKSISSPHQSPYGGSRQLTQCQGKAGDVTVHAVQLPEAVPYRQPVARCCPQGAKLRSVTSGTAIAAASSTGQRRGIAAVGGP